MARLVGIMAAARPLQYKMEPYSLAEPTSGQADLDGTRIVMNP
jgi:hypothetical protein